MRLKLGRVPATGIMGILQIGEQPTQLALALADLEGIAKTIHVLNYMPLFKMPFLSISAKAL